MEIKLNDTQKELLKIAKERGYLTLDDFDTAYSSPISARRNLRRFILAKLLKESSTTGRFDYIGGKKWVN